MYQDMSFKEISESTGVINNTALGRMALCFNEFAKSYRQASNCFDQLTISLSLLVHLKKKIYNSMAKFTLKKAKY
jgi:hypothetical protein